MKGTGLGTPELQVLVWGFGVNFVWEVAQSPLYADRGRGWGYLLWTRFHCTVGDALIALGAFALVALVLRDRGWLRTGRVAPVIAFTLLGAGYTVLSEWYNVQVAGAWAYAPSMPTIGGIGLAPVVQWIVLPAAIVRGAGREMRRSGGPA